MPTLGERLQRARQEKGLKQTEVMEYTNINNKTLSGYENNVSEPDLQTLKTLADIYSVSVDYLITGKEPEPLLETIKQFRNDEILLWFKSLPADLQEFLKDKDGRPWIELAKSMKDKNIPYNSVVNILNALADTIRNLKMIDVKLDNAMLQDMSNKQE